KLNQSNNNNVSVNSTSTNLTPSVEISTTTSFFNQMLQQQQQQPTIPSTTAAVEPQIQLPTSWQQPSQAIIEDFASIITKLTNETNNNNNSSKFPMKQPADEDMPIHFSTKKKSNTVSFSFETAPE